MNINTRDSLAAAGGSKAKRQPFERRRVRAIGAPNVAAPREVEWTPPPPPVREPLPEGTLVSKHIGWFRPEPNLAQLPARVRQGERVATVSALGASNSIVAPHDGVVTELFVRSGEATQYGQPVMCLLKA